MLHLLLTNIHDLDAPASETLKMIYMFGGTALACVVLIVILNMSRKIDRLKKELSEAQSKNH